MMIQQEQIKPPFFCVHPVGGNVHFLQQEALGGSGPVNCADWLEREREAFDVQIKWLASQRAPKRAFSPFGRFSFPVACHDRAARGAASEASPLAAMP